MIINTNTVELADVTVNLENTVIIAIAHNGVMNGQSGALSLY